MKIFIFHASAGHGHKQVAEVLRDAFLASGISGESVRLEDALDSSGWFFRKSYPSIYFHSVKRWPDAWGWFYENLDRAKPYAIVRPYRRLGNQLAGARLLQRMRQEQPDAIICTHFYAAELLGFAKSQGIIRSEMITVITDFYPHTFWVNPGTDHYWVMANETKEDLRRRGVEEERITVGGIPVHRKFLPSGKKAEIRKAWGFSPDRFTILLSSGSFGLGPQLRILEQLQQFAGRIQCFVVCGHNREMLKTIEQRKWDYLIKPFGFVDFMADLMEASDLLIAKPGGATTSESLVKGLPMVVLDPIPGQEARNAKLLREHNACFSMARPAQIQTILQTLLDNPKLLDEKRRNIQELAKPHAAEDLARFVLNKIGAGR